MGNQDVVQRWGENRQKYQGEHAHTHSQSTKQCQNQKIKKLQGRLICFVVMKTREAVMTCVFFGNKRREWDLKVLYTNHAYIQLVYLVDLMIFDSLLTP